MNAAMDASLWMIHECGESGFVWLWLWLQIVDYGECLVH